MRMGLLFSLLAYTGTCGGLLDNPLGDDAGQPPSVGGDALPGGALAFYVPGVPGLGGQRGAHSLTPAYVVVMYPETLSGVIPWSVHYAEDIPVPETDPTRNKAIRYPETDVGDWDARELPEELFPDATNGNAVGEMDPYLWGVFAAAPVDAVLDEVFPPYYG